MSYQWKVGELCIKDRDDEYGRPDVLPLGTITHVTDVRDEWEPEPPEDELEGIPIRVFGEDYSPLSLEETNDSWWSDGAYFRPLHGTDIRKLEEKYPEYSIKTNEVEG